MLREEETEGGTKALMVKKLKQRCQTFGGGRETEGMHLCGDGSWGEI